MGYEVFKKHGIPGSQYNEVYCVQDVMLDTGSPQNEHYSNGSGFKMFGNKT